MNSVLKRMYIGLLMYEWLSITIFGFLVFGKSMMLVTHFTNYEYETFRRISRTKMLYAFCIIIIWQMCDNLWNMYHHEKNTWVVNRLLNRKSISKCCCLAQTQTILNKSSAQIPYLEHSAVNIGHRNLASLNLEIMLKSSMKMF